MYTSSEHPLPMLALSMGFTCCHAISLILTDWVFSVTPCESDLQAICVAALRLVAHITAITLLQTIHDGPWVDFCVLTAILLLLVGETLHRVDVVRKSERGRFVYPVVGTVAIGVRFVSAAASLELDHFYLFIFLHLSIEFAYSLVYECTHRSLREPWVRRFDLCREVLCSVTMVAGLAAVCARPTWRGTILVVCLVVCNFCTLPFYTWAVKLGFIPRFGSRVQRSTSTRNLRGPNSASEVDCAEGPSGWF